MALPSPSKPIERELRDAARRYSEARKHRYETIRRAPAEGVTRRRIAEVVGLSKARIDQILAGRDQQS